MSHHVICITIDTDPDGLSSYEVNRNTLEFRGLENIFDLPEKMAKAFKINIPITWFIRIDGQLKNAFGDACYLYHKYENHWNRFNLFGHELGWHPHLYKANDDGTYSLMNDPKDACLELESLWSNIRDNNIRFVSFRNGEGWHSNETMNFVEQLGMIYDSTALPGRGSENQPVNWINTPNQPYYPDSVDYKHVGSLKRKLLEIPINTWLTMASYDKEPKIRYINPCIHEDIFENALEAFGKKNKKESGDLMVWTFICHPDDMLPSDKPDMLYALSKEVYFKNIARFCDKLSEIGHSFEFSTISKAGELWRKNFDK